MLDITYIKENTDAVKQGMMHKGEKDTSLVDQALVLDSKWREGVTRLDRSRSELNQISGQVGEMMKSGRKEEAQKLIQQTQTLKEEIKELDKAVPELRNELDQVLYQIPNVPAPSVPVGSTPDDNVVHSEWGSPRHEDHLKPHWELADQNHWLDFQRGVKVAGAGFPFYVGEMARLQRSLISFFLDSAVDAGYTELQAPLFVNEDSARGTGQIPDKEDMMYVIPKDGFFAIPTAEVPVTNFHRNEILEIDQLPVLYAAHTPCWRREAGSYGKDVKGLNRLHQFDKVELVKMVHPDQSDEELESLREHAESLLKALKIPFRTLLMCTGDMGFTQTKKYDLEVWSPGQKRWLEVSSCSNFGSFQARRMKLRYRTESGKTEMLHTLNGSGLALPRVMAALLEQYQRPDGRVDVPEVLKSRMGTDIIGSV